MLLSAFTFLISQFAYGGAAADLAKEIRGTALDADNCYRVRDLRFAIDEIKIYFSDGFLIFGKPVDGKIVSAIYSADVEGGDAELLLMPPLQQERRSLAAFARSPNLSEHFKHAVLIFTSDDAMQLLATAKASGAANSREMGLLLAGKHSATLANFATSFEVRLVQDLLSSRRSDRGFFYAAFGGVTLGNFDLIHDPRGRQQINVGQVAFRNDRRYFDVWTNFEAQSWRMGRRKTAEPEIRIEDFRIDATIHPDLSMKAVTRMRITPQVADRVLPLEISQRMRVTSVKVDGEEVESFAPESMRANLIRGNENNQLLLVGSRNFIANKPLEVEIAHEGNVILQAGEGVYFIASRGTWHPNRSLGFSQFDVTFRVPKGLDLVSSGNLVSETMDGEWKVIRRKTSAPARFFGFNLGDWSHTDLTRGGIKVDVCANRKLETALAPRPRITDLSPQPPVFPGRPQRKGNPQDALLFPVTTAPPNPAARLQKLAQDAATALEEMTARFGKPPIQTLTVSPIPGRFGQGFPGLVYLATLSYLDPSQRPASQTTSSDQLFFSDLLLAHEIAHQWWGNAVVPAGYQDEWLMESLANYSSVWLQERKKGPKAVDQILDEYRRALLHKDSSGATLESAGPITLGYRLYNSLSPSSWAAVTYQKGAWILHMLRRRMSDQKFQEMLTQLYKQYQFRSISSGEFQQLAASYMPKGSPDPKLEGFFETWVHGTGIPALKLSWSTSGKAPNVTLTGTVTQSEVDDDFSVWVPVEIQTGRGKPLIEWVKTDKDPVKFTVKLAAPPVKVLLDPSNTTLTRK
ncbi:MAG: hypothetical protein HYZ37_10760 [Candidatus Solibacter usitatus]|nr:hypothetical protein [Candidatus Solibacter usitatus]